MKPGHTGHTGHTGQDRFELAHWPNRHRITPCDPLGTGVAMAAGVTI